MSATLLTGEALQDIMFDPAEPDGRYGIAMVGDTVMIDPVPRMGFVVYLSDGRATLVSPDAVAVWGESE